MRTRVALGIVFGLAAVIAAPAQETPAAPPPQAPPPQQGPGPGAPSQGPQTPSPSPFPGQRDPRQQMPTQQPRDTMQIPDMQRPIFLSGKVVLEDGTPPPDSVTIERVCNGVVRPEAYTDSKGRFSFQLGQNMGVMPDASISSASDQFGGFGDLARQNSPGRGRGISERDLMGCELRASLAGFRSEVVSLSGRRVMDNPEVGTIILRRLSKAEGFTFSATSAMAPKDARKAFDKGKDAVRKQKWADAQKELDKAVQIYPKYATAWFELGMVHERQNNVEAARKAYAAALAADAKYVNPYLQLAQISARERKWQEVADTTERVVRLNPFDFPRAYFFNSVANLNLQRIDAAEKSAREALKLDTEHRIPKISHLLGVILSQKQELPEAIEHMRAYLKQAPNAEDAAQVKKQLAEMERFTAPKEGVQAQQQ